MTTHRDLTTPEEVLAACPLCAGGESRISESTHWTGMRSVVLSVTVTHWCAQVAGQPQSVLQVKGRTREDAIAAWNRRPRTFTAAEVAEVVAGIEAAFREQAERLYGFGPGSEQSGRRLERIRCADELHERITHWLRENT